MAYKNRLGDSRLGKNLTNLDHLVLDTISAADALFTHTAVSGSLILPTVTTAAPVNGSVYFDAATGRLYVYDSTAQYWRYFAPTGHT
jgi:hypothetical protein